LECGRPPTQASALPTLERRRLPTLASEPARQAHLPKLRVPRSV